jgi:hypothetical protein
VTTSARPNVDREFLRRLAVSTAVASSERTAVPTLRPATVVDSAEGVASVILDGDDSPVLAEVLVPEPLPDDRVMVLLQPPSGAFVVGYVGASRDRWGSGGGGATEVLVNTDQPTDRAELLLWVDTDATLPAPVSTGWQLLTLTPPWVNYGGWAPASIRRIGDVVELRGLVQPNGAGASTTIADVPAPTAGSLIFLGAADMTGGGQSFCRMDVGTNGKLVNGAAVLSYLSLSQIRYSVA